MPTYKSVNTGDVYYPELGLFITSGQVIDFPSVVEAHGLEPVTAKNAKPQASADESAEGVSV